MQRQWKVYLSGEIHSDWRKEISTAATKAKLPVEFYAPVTDHSASDGCGARILGKEPDRFWHDHKSAKINAIRTRTLIDDSDIVVVRIGDKYKEWGTAFDAGYAAAMNIPLIVLHQEEHIHALKEIDASACAVCDTVEQLVKILKYVIKGKF